jgi:hypothetical protein
MVLRLTFRLTGFNPKLVGDFADFFFRYNCDCGLADGHDMSPAQMLILTNKRSFSEKRR